MTVYWQHVGVAGATRDFPRTIGTQHTGLIHFNWQDVEGYLTHLGENERGLIQSQIENYAPDGFQIWGIPSGAKNVLRDLEVGDYLLLLETTGAGGQFTYTGRVIARPSKECQDLSNHLWGEYRFPLIVFLKGELTSYYWLSFCEDFHYKENWNPAGNTYRIREHKWGESHYSVEEELVRYVVGHDIPLEKETLKIDTTLLDLVELDLSEEGRQVLRQHLVRERSSKLIRSFKRSLSEYKCCVCGFDFYERYGEVGEEFIEAHHVKPVAEMEPWDKTKISDLIPVCANCHRMLHRMSPVMDWQELQSKINN